MHQFPFPLLSRCQEAIKRLAGLGKACLKQLVGDVPDGLLRGPSIELLRSPVPGDNDACRVAPNDGVIGQFHQAGLELRALFVAWPVLHTQVTLRHLVKRDSDTCFRRRDAQRKPCAGGRIHVLNVSDGLRVCCFVAFLPEHGADHFREDLPNIFSQQVIPFLVEDAFGSTIHIGTAPVGIHAYEPIVDAFKDGLDVPVKCELHLIGKRSRRTHAFRYDPPFEWAFHPEATTG